MTKRRRDTVQYHASDRVRKIKAAASRLDAHDLRNLEHWIREEGNAHSRAEHLAKVQGIFADMQTWEAGRELQVTRTFLLHNQVVPGEHLRFVATHKGRKHVGIWVERDSGDRVWFHLLRLDDLVPYDDKGITEKDERRHAELAQALGGLLQ